MSAIPVWVWAVVLGVGVIAAMFPYVIPALRLVSEQRAVRPAASQDAKPVAYSRADWINQLVTLANTAETLGQADVATASRALIAALVAVREKA